MIQAQHQTGVACVGGADIEFGNFIQGRGDGRRTSAEAAVAVLDAIDGWAGSMGSEAPRYSSDGSIYSTDSMRRYLACNGGCVYIDLGHVEVCVPEVTSARAFVAAHGAMLDIVRDARADAQERLRADERLRVLVNTSDGLGNSYGAHLNFLVPRSTYDRLFCKLNLMLMLASYQASSIVFTGQGKVGSENGQPAVDYQVTQRSDFIESVVGLQTTHRRPLINQRDEPLCGTSLVQNSPAQRSARLHVICYDSNLCETANYLKFGVFQIVLQMLHAECVSPGLLLEDPVEALHAWSHDITLSHRCATFAGDRLTAVGLQLRFLQQAQSFVEKGECSVNECEHILELWKDTLLKLQARDFESLAPRLDWVLKLGALREAKAHDPSLTWGSPEMRYLDHLYGCLDPNDGLFESFNASGLTEHIIDDSTRVRARSTPPEDTRAWTRAMLLRKGGRCVESIDWDRMTFSLPVRSGATHRLVLPMDDPVSMSRADTEHLFDPALPLAETLAALGARRVEPTTWTAHRGAYR